ncbi:MAG: hypothetical protein EBZ59_11290 [Planctomycetia bacterium]|nr:hypothetical protein [Planctomycetia bacterium]
MSTLTGMKNDREQGAPAPAAIGLVWRVAGVLAVPVLGAALMLWRSDALQNQELAALHAENITLRAALDEHLRSDAAAKTAATEREREFGRRDGRRPCGPSARPRPGRSGRPA